MKSHPGVAAKTFATLEAAGSRPRRLDLADQDRLPRPVDDVDRAVQALHEAFELG